jgi:sulfur carrier protein
VRIVLNGEPREVAERASVRDAIVAAGAPEEARGVAVAIDGEVVPRRHWDELPLEEGQRVEVVRAVQGG